MNTLVDRKKVENPKIQMIPMTGMNPYTQANNQILKVKVTTNRRIFQAKDGIKYDIQLEIHSLIDVGDCISFLSFEIGRDPPEKIKFRLVQPAGPPTNEILAAGAEFRRRIHGRFTVSPKGTKDVAGPFHIRCFFEKWAYPIDFASDQCHSLYTRNKLEGLYALASHCVFGHDCSAADNHEDLINHTLNAFNTLDRLNGLERYMSTGECKRLEFQMNSKEKMKLWRLFFYYLQHEEIRWLWEQQYLHIFYTQEQVMEQLTSYPIGVLFIHFYTEQPGIVVHFLKEVNGVQELSFYKVKEKDIKHNKCASISQKAFKLTQNGEPKFLLNTGEITSVPDFKPYLTKRVSNLRDINLSAPSTPSLNPPSNTLSSTNGPETSTTNSLSGTTNLSASKIIYPKPLSSSGILSENKSALHNNLGGITGYAGGSLGLAYPNLSSIPSQGYPMNVSTQFSYLNPAVMQYNPSLNSLVNGINNSLSTSMNLIPNMANPFVNGSAHGVNPLMFMNNNVNAPLNYNTSTINSIVSNPNFYPFANSQSQPHQHQPQSQSQSQSHSQAQSQSQSQLHMLLAQVQAQANANANDQAQAQVQANVQAQVQAQAHQAQTQAHAQSQAQFAHLFRSSNDIGQRGTLYPKIQSPSLAYSSIPTQVKAPSLILSCSGSPPVMIPNPITFWSLANSNLSDFNSYPMNMAFPNVNVDTQLPLSLLSGVTPSQSVNRTKNGSPIVTTKKIPTSPSLTQSIIVDRDVVPRTKRKKRESFASTLENGDSEGFELAFEPSTHKKPCILLTE